MLLAHPNDTSFSKKRLYITCPGIQTNKKTHREVLYEKVF